jgi:tetratricopeptide (TPR) repeat protein
VEILHRWNSVATITKIKEPENRRFIYSRKPMSHTHLNWSNLLTLIRRCEVPDQVLLDVLLACIEGCATCREGCGEFAEMVASGEVRAVDLSPETVGMALSRRRVAELWPEIESLDLQWARRRLAREPARWAMVERLAERSVELAASDAEAALATAALAVEVAERLPVHLPEEPYPADLVEAPFDEDAQLEALALAYAARGNAYRVGERYLLAEQEFHRIDRLQVAMPTLGFFPRVLSLRASLHYDRRRFEEALGCLEDAEHQLGGTGDLNERVRIRLQRAIILVYVGRPEAAQQLTASLLELYPATRHRDRFALAVLHGHVDVLSRLGEVDRAQEYLPEIQRLCAQVGQPEDRIRVDWVLARLRFEAGEFAASVAQYEEVADQWRALGHGFKWALVRLETAVVHLTRGNTQAVRRLTREALPILTGFQVAPDVFAVFKLLSDSGASDVQQLRALLRHLEALPSSRTVEATG